MSHNDQAFRSVGIARRCRKTFQHSRQGCFVVEDKASRSTSSHVSQFHLCQRRAKTGVVSIAGTSQRHTPGDASFTGTLDLFQCDVRLGLKLDLVRNTRLLPPFSILGPHLWQVQVESLLQSQAPSSDNLPASSKLKAVAP
jgi:hypothetical protein